MSGTASAGAAVKADAYGIGAAQAVPVLRDAGCRDFFVAHWSEAAVVAALVGPASVAVLHGPQTPADAAYARALGVRPVINSLPQARIWRDAGGGPCHVMVDTGMNRLGLSLAQLADPLVAGLEIDALLSHLASAEDDTPLNAAQLARWQEARRMAAHARASLANSAGIMLGEAYHGDLSRPGIALYGGVPCAALAPHIRQVVRPEAAIIQVRDLSAGDTVGYGSTFTAPAPMRIGVVACGYADGYPRHAGTGTPVLVDGVRTRTLGRVSMDMLAVDLTPVPDAGQGSEVTLWGRAANGAVLPIDEVARQAQTVGYELMCALAQRVPVVVAE